MPSRSNETSPIASLAARSDIRDALDWIARSESLLAEETSRITEIPAPTFQEEARAAYVAERFHALGLLDVEVATDGNVYGRMPGLDLNARAPLAVYAHLDTVFAADVPVSVTAHDGRLHAPGVGDNAAGVAGLLGALEALRQAKVSLNRPIWIVATVGEEGLGDLRGARSATARLAGSVDSVLAVEGSFFGRVSHVAVGSRRFRIGMQSNGGHSWHDFGRPSAIHTLVEVATEISGMNVPAEPRTTFNIGQIRGGTGVNVIAECAELLLDIRSVDTRQLDDLEARVRTILAKSRRPGIRATIETVGDRPAGSIPQSHPLVQICAAVLGHLGAAPQFAAASTDANAALGAGVPAVTLGITRGGGAHTVGEWIETRPMIRGVQQLVLVLCALSNGTTIH
jgi:tripeptide aminopeptidase